MYKPPTVCQNFTAATVKRSVSSLGFMPLTQTAKHTARTGIECNCSGILEIHHPEKLEKIGPRVGISKWTLFLR